MKVKINLYREEIFTIVQGKYRIYSADSVQICIMQLAICKSLINKSKLLELLWPNLTLFCVWVAPPPRRPAKSLPRPQNLQRTKKMGQGWCYYSPTLTASRERYRSFDGALKLKCI